MTSGTVLTAIVEQNHRSDLTPVILQAGSPTVGLSMMKLSALELQECSAKLPLIIQTPEQACTWLFASYRFVCLTWPSLPSSQIPVDANAVLLALITSGPECHRFRFEYDSAQLIASIYKNMASGPVAFLCSARQPQSIHPIWMSLALFFCHCLNRLVLCEPASRCPKAPALCCQLMSGCQPDSKEYPKLGRCSRICLLNCAKATRPDIS